MLTCSFLGKEIGADIPKWWEETWPSVLLTNINPTTGGEFDWKGEWYGRTRWAENKRRQNCLRNVHI